jgi:plastocyanin
MSSAQRRLAVVLSLVALTAVACGGSSKSESTTAPPISLPGTTNNHGTKTASGSMEVELDDFYFEPTFIKAKPGEKITIEVKNEGKAVHTFTSTDLGNVDEQLAAGTSKKITVTAPQSGQAVFFCRFHQSQGMQGAIYIG